MNPSSPLVIFPPGGALAITSNGAQIPQRFLDGIAQYQQLWNGPVEVLWSGCQQQSLELDRVACADLPFTLTKLSDASELLQRYKREEAVVLAALEPDCLPFIKQLLRHKIPTVFVTTNSYQTRREVVRVQTRNPIIRWRRYLYQFLLEREYRKLIPQAQGLQCNGLPTYLDYKDLNTNTLLYFDSRLSAEQMGHDPAVPNKDQPLRLVFAGRLLPIKGVADLPAILQELDRRHCSVTLDIYGDGPEKAPLHACLEAMGALDRVRFHGFVPQQELYQCLQSSADLFVCTHKQGDPSHLYVEMLGCGVPIIGYPNGALTGLEQLTPACSSVADQKPESLARAIADVHRDRENMRTLSICALEFARQHEQTATFRRRVQQLAEAALSDRQTTDQKTQV